MKRLILLSSFIFFSSAVFAQTPVSTLNENFNVTCATASFPSSDSWLEYNSLPATVPSGEWACTATNGRPTPTGTPTPGMQCTGVYGGTNNIDTSYLITPLLDLSTYTSGHIYLEFDSKTTNINSGGRLAVGRTVDSTPVTVALYTDLTASVTPVIGEGDSSGWVTHQLDLTSYVSTGPFYIAFRYTSPATGGNIWYLDNINLTTSPLNVTQVNKEVLPLTVIGNSTPSQITLSYSVPEAGFYHIVMFDMVGRKVYDGQLIAQSGRASYIINNLGLHPGLYCVKMGNDNTYGTTKVMIQ